MIYIKSQQEIEQMRDANAIVRDVLLYLEEKVKPGISTLALDKWAYDFIKSKNAAPSFLGYQGFPASICASINDEVVHGIPSARVLQEGDIVSVDVGAFKNGFHGDAARTFAVGDIDSESKRLIEVTKQSFFEGVKFAVNEGRLGDISEAIQTYVETNGYSVVRDLVGHGIGREMHEDPNVPNYGKSGKGVRLKTGMALAIEPMVNMGTYAVGIDTENGWTVFTRDKQRSAHYENTIAITSDGPVILTL